jgi:hypothetical protein
MGLDLWFRDDVLRILGAVCAGVSGAVAANTPLDQEYAAAYRQGFEDAVRAVAVGFGVADRKNGRTEEWKAGRLADW